MANKLKELSQDRDTTPAPTTGGIVEEIESMRQVYLALSPLDPHTRGRVLKWVIARMDSEMAQAAALAAEAAATPQPSNHSVGFGSSESESVL